MEIGSEGAIGVAVRVLKTPAGVDVFAGEPSMLL
jgi:hypothetical protein